MNILITNDDGYRAKGIRVLAEIMRRFGDVSVIGPKSHQSGMSAAVSLGYKQIGYRKLGYEPAYTAADGTRMGSLTTAYLDATPASCVKFGINFPAEGKLPDVVVSGINHGSNAASAACYSGTLGAAEEGAINAIPAIGVSIDTHNPEADLRAIEKHFPAIFEQIMENLPDRKGIYYNINFPDIPKEEIKGVRTGYQGRGRWIKEFMDWNPEFYAKYGLTPEMLGQHSEAGVEEGEELYMMVGTFADDEDNTADADHRLVQEGYISIVAHQVDATDYTELARLRSLGFDHDF